MALILVLTMVHIITVDSLILATLKFSQFQELEVARENEHRENTMLVDEKRTPDMTLVE